METKTKNVYAVIVTHNGTTWIRQAIESIQQSTFPIRIVVVDNASTDETVKTIQNLYRQVEIFSMPVNLGFGRANNHGIHYALSQGADYVLLLNQDATVAPVTVEELVNLLEGQPDYGILSPLHLDFQGDAIDREFIPYIQENTCLICDAFLGRLQKLYEVSFINAAVWLVKQRVFETVGGFDPLFFIYGEDNDYCQRVRYHGFKIGLAPQVLANHWHGGSQRESNTLKGLFNRLSVQVIHLLKRPERHFLQNILGVLIGWIRMSMHQLIELDLKRFCATWLSLMWAIAKIHTIRKHYKVCKKPVRPWL